MEACLGAGQILLIINALVQTGVNFFIRTAVMCLFACLLSHINTSQDFWLAHILRLSGSDDRKTSFNLGNFGNGLQAAKQPSIKHTLQQSASQLPLLISMSWPKMLEKQDVRQAGPTKTFKIPC